MSKSRDWSRWRSRIVKPHLTGIRNSSDGFTIRSLNFLYGSRALIFEIATILKFYRFVKIVCNISIYLMWFEMTRTAPKWSRSDRRRPIKPTENQKLNPFCTYSEIFDCEPPGCVSASDLRLTFNSWSEVTTLVFSLNLRSILLLMLKAMLGTYFVAIFQICHVLFFRWP